MIARSDIPRIWLDAILAEVLAEFPYLDRATLRSHARASNVTRPRQIAFALARELSPATYRQIGNFFGKFDHSTVWWGIHAVAAAIEAGDADLERAVDAIRARLLARAAPPQPHTAPQQHQEAAA